MNDNKYNLDLDILLSPPTHPSHDFSSLSPESSPSSSTRCALPHTVASHLPSSISNSSTSTRYALPPNPENQLPTLHTTTNLHLMITRRKLGIIKPNHPFIGHLNTTTLPHNVFSSIQNPVWFQAMQVEYSALQKNDTWSLVPRTPHMNVVGSK